MKDDWLEGQVYKRVNSRLTIICEDNPRIKINNLKVDIKSKRKKNT